MKKILSAVALCALCASPLTAMAEGTTVYGELKYSINSVDDDTLTGKDGWSGEDNISLFGIKGSYGNDVKAFFHLQTQANADSDASGIDKDAFKQRFFFGGLEGAFGKVAYGRMTNAYKFDGFKMDPFYNYSHVSATGLFGAGGATYGLSPATNGFTDNSLQYVTPSLAGFKVTTAIYIDDADDDNSNDDHGYLGGVSYTMKGLSAGVVYASNHGAETTDDATLTPKTVKDYSTMPGIAADGEAIRGYVNYKISDNLKLGLSVEQVDIYTSAVAKANNYDEDAIYGYLTGTMVMPDINMEFSASLGMVDDGAAEGWGTTVGAWYNIAKNTKLFTLVSYADISADELLYGADSDRSPLVISIGAQHKFSLSSK